MLGAHVLVRHPPGFCFGGDGHLVQPRREPGLGAAIRRRDPGQQLTRAVGDLRRVGIHLSQKAGDNALALLDERHEEMFRLELWIVAPSRELDG